MSAYYPDKFVYAGSLSGFLNRPRGWWPMLIGMAMRTNSGFQCDRDVGSSSDPRGSEVDPMLQIPRLVADKLGISGCMRQRHTERIRRRRSPAKFLEGFTLRPTSPSRDNYLQRGGSNGVFTYPTNGTHSWPYWVHSCRP